MTGKGEASPFGMQLDAKGASQPDRGRRIPVLLYLIFLSVIALTGGTSVYNAPTLMVVRLAAILLIGALILLQPERRSAGIRPAYWFLGALAGWILLQLIPLPPALWGALPEHHIYLEAAAAAGQPQPWRPINLAPDHGWNALFALLPPAAVLFTASRLRMRDQGAVLMALILIVMASAILGLAQISVGGTEALRFYSGPPTEAAVGLLNNRNHHALLIGCGLPLLALWVQRGQADRAKRRLHTVLALAGGAFLALTIPTTGSRSGLLLAVIALPGALLLAWPAIRGAAATLSARQRRLALGAGLAMLVLLIAAPLVFARAESVQRLFASDLGDEARVQAIRPLFVMIRNFLPFGSGFGSFEPLYRAYEPFAALNPGIMNQAHDDYLQVALEGGLPGLLFLLAFLVWWGRTTLRLWRRSGGEGTALARLGSILLLLMILASLTDYPVRMPLIMVIAAQAAAWMLLPRGRQEHD